jgi:hypothetical protein
LTASGVRYPASGKLTRAQHAGGVKPDRHLLQVDRAPDQQGGPGEDDHHDRCLCRDERLPQPGDERAGHGALAVAEVLAQVPGRRRPRRQHADDDRAGDGKEQRHDEHRTVERGRGQARHALGRRGEEERQCPPGGEHAGESAEQGEHEALGQHLANDAEAPGPERGSDGQLARADGETREEEIRGVAAGDRQHERDRQQQHHQAKAEVADNGLVQPFAGGAAVDVLVGMVAPQALGDSRQFTVDLRQRDVLPTAPVQVQVVLVVHRQPLDGECHRYDHLGLVGNRLKGQRHHADHGVRLAVEAQDLSERVRSSAEAPQPQTMPDHRDQIAPRPILVGREGTAQLRGHFEHVEPGVGHAHADDPFGLVATGQVEARERRGRQRRQHRRALADVLVVAGRRVAGAILPRRIDREHAFRMGVGKRREHDGVHHAEDRGGGADADGQCEHDAEREPRLLASVPQSETSVQQQV